MDQYDKLKKESVDQFLSTLPPKQKLAVEACISAAKVKGPNGRRYTKQWMYECILMRFRGPALYRKMQRENTLPLPSTRTIQRYLKKMSPAYGFQRATFELLAEKAKEMPEDERHGNGCDNNHVNKLNFLVGMHLRLIPPFTCRCIASR